MCTKENHSLKVAALRFLSNIKEAAAVPLGDTQLQVKTNKWFKNKRLTSWRWWCCNCDGSSGISDQISDEKNPDDSWELLKIPVISNDPGDSWWISSVIWCQKTGFMTNTCRSGSPASFDMFSEPDSLWTEAVQKSLKQSPARNGAEKHQSLQFRLVFNSRGLLWPQRMTVYHQN